MASLMLSAGRMSNMLGLVLGASLLLGCGQEGSTANGDASRAKRMYGLPPGTTPAPATSLPTGASRTQIELAEPEIKSLAPQKYKATLHYNFTHGRPRTGLVYLVHIQFTGVPVYEAKRFIGTDLSTSGILEWEFELPVVTGRGAPAPAEYSIQMSESEVRQGGQTGFVGRSNTATGTIVP